MRNVGICVIGLGMGSTHARHFGAMDDVDLYVCDLDTRAVERAQQECNVVGVFPSIEEVLASEAVDGVDLALPHHLHCPVAVRAAAAGKHCMTEVTVSDGSYGYQWSRSRDEPSAVSRQQTTTQKNPVLMTDD